MAAERRPGVEAGAHGTTRLEAFSDGVFAIAITLLVLELRPPELGEGQRGFGDMLRALGHLWPEYLAYVVSFLTIANAWMSHHSIFRLIVRTDQALVYLNTLLLLLVAFIPFPTGLIAQYEEDGAGRAAMLVYGTTVTLLAVVYAMLWRYAARGRRLIAPETSQADLDLIRRRTRFTVPLYLLIALLSQFLNVFGPVPILLVAILYPLSFPIVGGRRESEA